MSKTGLPLNVFELGRVPPSAAGGWVLFLEPMQRSTQRFVRVILATTMLSVILAGGYANLHRKNSLHFSVPVLKGVLPSTLPLAASQQSEKIPWPVLGPKNFSPLRRHRPRRKRASDHSAAHPPRSSSPCSCHQ